MASAAKRQPVGAVFKHGLVGRSWAAQQGAAQALDALDDDGEDAVERRRVVDAVKERADYDGRRSDRGWERIRVGALRSLHASWTARAVFMRAAIEPTFFFHVSGHGSIP